MLNTQILDYVLLPLADAFEEASMKYREFTPSGPDEFEPLRETIAALMAEGSLEQYERARFYRLTPEGYKKYRDRISALRVLAG